MNKKISFIFLFLVLISISYVSAICNDDILAYDTKIVLKSYDPIAGDISLNQVPDFRQYDYIVISNLEIKSSYHYNCSLNDFNRFRVILIDKSLETSKLLMDCDYTNFNESFSVGNFTIDIREEKYYFQQENPYIDCKGRFYNLESLSNYYIQLYFIGEKNNGTSYLIKTTPSKIFANDNKYVNGFRVNSKIELDNLNLNSNIEKLTKETIRLNVLTIIIAVLAALIGATSTLPSRKNSFWGNFRKAFSIALFIIILVLLFIILVFLTSIQY